MADILALRTTMRAATANLAAQQAKLDQFELDLENALGDGLPPGPFLMSLRQRVMAQQRVVLAATKVLADATSAYQAAVVADPMHSVDAGLPLVLLPIRIETAYLPGADGTDLVVRVYPDDIHVDTHEPELTPRELACGTGYWKAVWGAGPNQARLDAAWTKILGQLKPLRAAWAVHVLTPAAARPVDETPVDQTQPIPPLPDVPTRPGTFNRAPRTTLLPDHWHIIGLQGGVELFNVDGSPIPDSLDVSFGPPGTGAPASDLPFDQNSRWLVDLDAAIAIGMAVRIPLAGPNLAIDQLFVLGVSSAVAPDDAVTRFESALIAHQYTNGFAFLPPGTPTNNTSKTRSAWQSAPLPPTPTDNDNARAGYQAASNQNAAVTARALGIDGSVALSIAPDALTDQQFAITILQQHLWNAVAAPTLDMVYTTWDIPAGGTPWNGTWTEHIDFPGVQALKDHFTGWVRSAGTLPVMRVGQQPYGLLPALSLDDWAAADGDPTIQLIGWLRNFRDYWLAGVANTPRVLEGADPNADSTVVNVLSRLPVSVDIMLRVDGNPTSVATSSQPLPLAPIPGLAQNSKLFLSVPGDSAVPLGLQVVSDPAGDLFILTTFQSMFHDGIAVMEGTMLSADYRTKYQSVLGAKTIPGAPPPDLFNALIQDAFSDPLAQKRVNDFGSTAGLIMCLAAFYDPTKADAVALAQQSLPDCRAFVADYDILCTVDPATYETSLRQMLDVFSHRLDAWITSLAARRLGDMRTTKPVGLVIGAYGWVEDLAPRTDPPTSQQTYIHAPSMHHAATAAVLRAGFESHAHPDALAVNLVSSRVRIADWLAEGVRNGQTVGALLGYRFERGLHDVGKDGLIAPLRTQFPLPLPTGPDGDFSGKAARDAIAARNVVDGLALYRSRDSVLASQGGDPDVAALLNDLVNAVDAFGDLLLAESVHHLVGGNPLRAGLAADTVGRGDPIPDRFEVVLTPRSGQPLTWQVGALLAADFSSAAAGWQSQRPRALAEPHVDAWVATLLGNASSWQIVCSVTAGDTVSSQTVSLDSLGIAALEAVTDLIGNPSVLESRIAELVSAGQPAGATVMVQRSPNADGTLGFAELLGLTDRMRAVLGKSTALTPQHLQGADTSPALGFNAAELDARVAALEASFGTAVQTLADSAAALVAASGSDAPTILAAVQAIRSALIGLADHGIPAAWPAAGADSASTTVDTLNAQAASLLSAVQPLANQARPAVPGSSASDADVLSWFGVTTQYVQSIVGAAIPIVGVYTLPPDSAYASAFAAAPAGSDVAAVMVWLRRMARVRANSAAWHDLLLATEALQASGLGLTTAQLPAVAGAPWVGLPFPDAAPPTAKLAHVFSTLAAIDPAAAFCGFLCDTWTETLPGLTTVANPARGYESAEVTGMAFTVDAPSASAPQAMLLAIAPDAAKGWSLDILFDTVRETLDLAKIRAVDIGDLPRLGRVLPAIHSSYVVDQLIQAGGRN